jgi:hypothetical protein
MSERSDHADEGERTLYGVLSEPAPEQGALGETALTATKETIDNDREEPGEALLLLGD